MHQGNRYQPTLIVTTGIGMAGRDGKVVMDTLERFCTADQAVIDGICCWLRVDHGDWSPGSVFAFEPQMAVARLTEAAEALETIKRSWTDYRGAAIKMLAMAKLAGAQDGMLCVKVCAALPGRVTDIRQKVMVLQRRQAALETFEP